MTKYLTGAELSSLPREAHCNLCPLCRQGTGTCVIEQGECSQFAGQGYVCAPVWTCRNNTIITDGKVIDR